MTNGEMHNWRGGGRDQLIQGSLGHDGEFRVYSKGRGKRLRDMI